MLDRTSFVIQSLVMSLEQLAMHKAALCYPLPSRLPPLLACLLDCCPTCTVLSVNYKVCIRNHQIR
jgi:hypothetical protein